MGKRSNSRVGRLVGRRTVLEKGAPEGDEGTENPGPMKKRCERTITGT